MGIVNKKKKYQLHTKRVLRKKVLLSLRPDACNVTPLRRVLLTRLVLTCTDLLVESLVKLKVTLTLMPTRRRVSSGPNRPCPITWRTQRSTFQVPRWLWWFEEG